MAPSVGPNLSGHLTLGLAKETHEPTTITAGRLRADWGRSGGVGSSAGNAGGHPGPDRATACRRCRRGAGLCRGGGAWARARAAGNGLAGGWRGGGAVRAVLAGNAIRGERDAD